MPPPVPDLERLFLLERDFFLLRRRLLLLEEDLFRRCPDDPLRLFLRPLRDDTLFLFLLREERELRFFLGDAEVLFFLLLEDGRMPMNFQPTILRLAFS